MHSSPKPCIISLIFMHASNINFQLKFNFQQHCLMLFSIQASLLICQGRYECVLGNFYFELI